MAVTPGIDGLPRTRCRVYPARINAINDGSDQMVGENDNDFLWGDGGNDYINAGMESDVVSLLEENARLRALVVRLSDLVLKSVVDQK